MSTHVSNINFLAHMNHRRSVHVSYIVIT